MALLQIPKPVTETVVLNKENWKISIYEEYLPHFKTVAGGWNPEILSELEREISPRFQNNFRLQLHLKAVPFLVGFLADKKEIVIASPRLSRELFLIERVSTHEEEIELLQRHVEKIESIDLNTQPTVIERITKQYQLPDFTEDPSLKVICEKSRRLEEKLLKHLNRYRPTLFERLSDLFLKLTAKYALFRIHLLKFIAILPCLDHDKKGIEVKKVYLETLRRLLKDSSLSKQPLSFSLTLLFKLEYFFSQRSPARFLSHNIRFLVRMMARRFIAGEAIEKAAQTFKGLRKTGRDATLDQLGELVVSEKEADHYCEQVLKIIRGLSLHVKKGEKNSAGIQRAHVSIKVSALASDFKPQASEYTYNRVAPRLCQILLEAKRHDVFINIDAEHYPYRDLIFYIYKRVLMETPKLKNYQATGIAVQAYLRDAYEHFQKILSLAKERGLMMPVRLVKGAYWDQETIQARAQGFDAPQFLNKEETDTHFRQLTIKILEAASHLQLCLGSHNLADHCFAETIRAEKFPRAPKIEHQCLHMTYEALSKGMAKMGWAVRNYVPIGSLLVGMAYLVRRIMENSSQVGILTQMRAGVNFHAPIKLPYVWDPSIASLEPEFFNTVPLRLFIQKEKEALDKSFQDFTQNKLGQDYSRGVFSGEVRKIFSPSNPETFVGEIRTANLEDAKKSLEKTYQAYMKGEWAKASPIERASIFLKAADLLLLKRLELTALMVHEGGKNFSEAIADVNEAIDFLNFYAREEYRLNLFHPHFVSRGVFGVISPWNFPLAIPAGMVTGALIAGNTALLKPAEHTPLITQRFADILHEAGLPEDVFIHLPGKGSEVGKLLVEDSKIAGIVFTGSKEVGMWIAHTAGKKIVHNEVFGFEAPAKVITEMGGKNAILVTSNAELDETVAGILYSAFGNAGQKCSAASRVLVDSRIKERLIQRLQEACRDLKVGPAFDHASFMNPLIAKKEKERLQKEAFDALREAKLYGGRIVIDRSKENLPGWCMGPVVIELPAFRSANSNSFARKELFGPILHIMSYSSLQEAVRLFNETEFGLTGGIFSQSQDDVDFLAKQIEAGNVYVNRPITGARVAVEPFGGFKLSGTGPKVGCPFYLEAFHASLGSKEKKMAPPFQKENAGLVAEQMRAAYSHFTEKNYWNRKIPGQLSFNDFGLTKQKGLYIALENPPDEKTFLYLLAALTVGARVEVLCRNKEVYKTWLGLRKNLEKLSVNLSNPSRIQKACQEKELRFLILEGGASEVKYFLDIIYDGTYSEKTMRTVLTKLDAPDMHELERYIEPFLHVRSFAVNVMRHGAPLELES